MNKILICPDTQVKPGVNTDHLAWLGKYICDIRPDTIIMLGDHYDLPSLSSYDRGTAAIEGKRLIEDLRAGDLGIKKLKNPIYQLNQAQAKYKKKLYSPRFVFLKGNHEERLDRYLNHHPELIGVLPSITDRLIS